jgi:hypothetical protein
MADDVIDGGTTDTTIDSAAPEATVDDSSAAIASENETTFFDPNAVPEGLEDAYKGMQGEFTRKMQGISDRDQQITARAADLQRYDNFMSNPEASVRALAHHYGVQFGGQPTANNAQPDDKTDWQPQTWKEVSDVIRQEAQADVMTQLEPMIAPVINELKSLKGEQIKGTLDKHWPEWKAHEADMNALLQQHPTLANDPVTLAKMATPAAEQEAKAYKKAMAALQKNQNSSRVATGSPGVQSSTKPAGKMSFNESYLEAKRKLG